MSKRISIVSKYPEQKPTNIGTGEGTQSPTPEEIASKHANTSLEYILKGVETSRSEDRGVTASTYDEYSDSIHALLDFEYTQPDFSDKTHPVGIEQTGLKFTIGKLCRPNSKDLEYALGVLYDMGVFEEDLIEWDFEWTELFSANSYEWRKKYIHRVVNALGVTHHSEYGWMFPWTPSEMDKDDTKLLALLWILMCWDWVMNPGKRPEPRLPGVFNAKSHTRVSVKDFRCPICGRPAPEQPVRTPLADRLRNFQVWLPGHAREYHRYTGFTHRRMHKPKKFKRSPK